jgi:hypothetical protein
MKLRIRIPGLGRGERDALERRTRLFLGRHISAIESVEFARKQKDRSGVAHADCELVVRLREGRAIRVHDDGDQLHRALLRAAWCMDQRRELGRLRDGAPRDPAGRAT